MVETVIITLISSRIEFLLMTLISMVFKIPQDNLRAKCFTIFQSFR